MHSMYDDDFLLICYVNGCSSLSFAFLFTFSLRFSSSYDRQLFEVCFMLNVGFLKATLCACVGKNTERDLISKFCLHLLAFSQVQFDF